MTGLPLDQVVAQALFAARQLEAALHGSGPWSMRWGTVEVPAERIISEHGVIFRATFPNLCWLEPPGTSILLLQAGELLGIRTIDAHPGDTEFVVSWELAASVEAKALN